MSEPFFTPEDFIAASYPDERLTPNERPGGNHILSLRDALYFANTKAQSLIQENARLKERYEFEREIHRHAAKEQLRLQAALEEICEEPNKMGPMADEIVDEYGLRAWEIARETLETRGQ